MDLLFDEFTNTKMAMIFDVDKKLREVQEQTRLAALVLSSLASESAMRKDSVIDDLLAKALEMKKSYKLIDENEIIIANLEDQLTFINHKK